MEIDTLILGSYQVNCYIVSENGRCVIIDPGYEPEAVASFLQDRAMVPEAILLTHGHFDHVGGVRELAKRFAIPVYLHEADRLLPPGLTRPMDATEAVEDGDTVEAAGILFRVLHTPGHTEGSVCYLMDGVMFSGDTLFAGSCGRVDLAGGNPAKMRRSLRRLAALEGDCKVCPGHGGTTTLSVERMTNPYF